MHSIPSTRRPRLSAMLRACLLLIATAAFAACDQHSAEEAPENYGHGSSHERVVPDHKIDSTVGHQSFSDTAGTKDEAAEEGRPVTAGSPTPTPANHFF